MVREGGEEPGEEAEEDGAAGRAGEGDHHAEYQHQVHHHPQVPGWGCRGPAGCGDPQGPSGAFRDPRAPARPGPRLFCVPALPRSVRCCSSLPAPYLAQKNPTELSYSLVTRERTRSGENTPGAEMIKKKRRKSCKRCGSVHSLRVRSLSEVSACSQVLFHYDFLGINAAGKRFCLGCLASSILF